MAGRSSGSKFDQRAGDAMTHSASLAREARAVDGADDVDFRLALGGFERLLIIRRSTGRAK